MEGNIEHVDIVSEPKAQPSGRSRKTKEVKSGPALAPDTPSAIPDELPKGINFNTDNQKVRDAFGVTLAKVLVILTMIAADNAKQPAIAMKDEEALGMAIPASIILMRLGWFQKMIAQYGQYAVSMDEYIMLFMAIYLYYNRVRKEMDHELVRRGDALGPKQATPERLEHGGSNGPLAFAGVPIFGRDA